MRAWRRRGHGFAISDICANRTRSTRTKIGYRCSAEPVANYVAKGGKIEDTVGRKCLCNALMANIGHAQTRKDGSAEPPLVTIGDDLNTAAQFLEADR